MKKYLKARTVKNMALALSVAVASSNVVPAMATESEIDVTNEIVSDEVENTEENETLEDVQADETLEDKIEQNEPLVRSVVLASETGTITYTTDDGAYKFTISDESEFTEALNSLNSDNSIVSGSHVVFSFTQDITFNSNVSISTLRDFTTTKELKITFTTDESASSNPVKITSSVSIELPRATTTCEFIIKNLNFAFTSGSEGSRRLYANANKLTMEDCDLRPGTSGDGATLFGGFSNGTTSSTKNTIDLTLRNVKNVRDIQLCSLNGGKNTFDVVNLTLGEKIILSGGNNFSKGLGINIGGYSSTSVTGSVGQLNITIEKDADVQAGATATTNNEEGGILGTNRSGFASGNFHIYNVNFDIRGTLSGLGNNNIANNATITGYIDLSKVTDLKADIFSGRTLDGLELYIPDGSGYSDKIQSVLSGVSDTSSVSVTFNGSVNTEDVDKIAELGKGIVDNINFKNFEEGTDIPTNETTNENITELLENATFTGETTIDFDKIVDFVEKNKNTKDIIVKTKLESEDYFVWVAKSLFSEEKNLISFTTYDEKNDLYVVKPDHIVEGTGEEVEEIISELPEKFDNLMEGINIQLDLSELDDISGLFGEGNKDNLVKITSIKVGEKLTNIFGENTESWTNTSGKPAITGTVLLSEITERDVKNFNFDNLELKVGNEGDEVEKAFGIIDTSSDSSTFAVTFCGDATFDLSGKNVTKVTEINLEKTVKTIAANTFKDLQFSFIGFTIPATVTTIEENAFENTKQSNGAQLIVSIEEDDKITTIGANAFNGVIVNASNGINITETINKNAFAGSELRRPVFKVKTAENLETALAILESASGSENGFTIKYDTTIEFTGTEISGLQDINLEGYQDEQGDTVSLKIKYPQNTVVSINENAFNGTTGLGTITLSSDVSKANGTTIVTNNIGANAFVGQTVTGSLKINGMNEQGEMTKDGCTINEVAFAEATLENFEFINRVDKDNIEKIEAILKAVSGGNVTVSVSEIDTDVRDTLTAIDNANENLTINIKDFAIQSFTVTFELNGGELAGDLTQAVESNGKVTNPGKPTRTGYDFDDWYVYVEEDGELLETAYNFDTPVTGNITLQAKWTANENTVTFDFNGGTLEDSENSKIEIPLESGNAIIRLEGAPINPSEEELTKDNLTFAGWYEVDGENGTINYESKPYDFNKEIDGDVYLKAGWEATVTFEIEEDGEVFATETVFEGGKVAKPSQVPSKDGNIFIGWVEVLSGNTYDFDNSEVTEHITLRADWEAGFNLIFDTNGGEYIEPQGIKEGATTKEPDTPVRAGYTFEGWYADTSRTTPFKFGEELTRDTTIYAKWSVNKYIVDFETDGGSAIPSKQVTYGDRLDLVTPTKQGCTFEGWYLDEEFKNEYNENEDFKYESDITLYAKWSKNIYTVSFDLNGGEYKHTPDGELSGKEVSYGDELELPTADDLENGDLEFEGWYTDSNLTKKYEDTVFKYEGDITLYAKWLGKECEITFTDGESVIKKTTVRNGDTLVLPTLTKQGYTFEGWYLDESLETKYDNTTPFTLNEDTTLYAKWTENTISVSFNVVLNANGGLFKDGSISKTVVVEQDSAISTPESPTRTGYTFEGWYNTATGEKYDFDAPVTEAITLQAKWIANEYTVTFNSNGGTIATITDKDGNVSYNSTKVKQGDILAEPVTTRPGYELAGWYSSSEFTTKYDFSKAFTLGSDVTLYAKWVKVASTETTTVITTTPSASSGGGGGSSSSSSSSSTTTQETAQEETTEETIIQEETTQEAEEATQEVTETTQEVEVTETKELNKEVINLPEINEEKVVNFTDVEETHWASSTIEKLAQAGILSGDENGEFNPTGNSKRADVTIMLVKLLGLEGETPTTNFNDVSADKYYANYVGIAKEYGIVNGSNGNFNPEESISRQDTMVMTANILKSLGIEANNDTSALEGYKDFSSISSYAQESVAILVNAGIITGSNGNINPKADVTRAEMSVIVAKLYDLLGANLNDNN